MEIHSSLRDLKMVIYIIIHRPTGFCYVGQTSHKLKKRIVQHLRGKKQFVDKIIRIEGRDKFEVGVLDVCTSLAQLREREHHWIVYCEKFNSVIDAAEHLIFVRRESAVFATAGKKLSAVYVSHLRTLKLMSENLF